MPIKSYLETAALRGQCAYENGIRDDDCPYSQKQYVMAWLRGWGLARAKATAAIRAISAPDPAPTKEGARRPTPEAFRQLKKTPGSSPVRPWSRGAF